MHLVVRRRRHRSCEALRALRNELENCVADTNLVLVLERQLGDEASVDQGPVTTSQV